MVASTSVTEGPALTLGGAETTGPIPVFRPDEDDQDHEVPARAAGS